MENYDKGENLSQQVVKREKWGSGVKESNITFFSFLFLLHFILWIDCLFLFTKITKGYCITKGNYKKDKAKLFSKFCIAQG